MSARQRHVEKSLRIEHGKIAGHEQVLYGFESRLRRLRAIRMASHTVKNEHHRGIIGDDHCSTILVVFAVTECRNFCVFNLHGIKVVAIGLQQQPQLRMLFS